MGGGESVTRLVVSSVGPGDSGMYSCVPPGSHPASVRVHIQKGLGEYSITEKNYHHVDQLLQILVHLILNMYLYSLTGTFIKYTKIMSFLIKVIIFHLMQ